jgi:hypothetical protein
MLSKLKSNTNSPDFLQLQRQFLADQPPLVPTNGWLVRKNKRIHDGLLKGLKGNPFCAALLAQQAGEREPSFYVLYPTIAIFT